MVEPSLRARYYDVARIAHLERLSEMVPADFFFRRNRADWDQSLAESIATVNRVSTRGLLARIWKHNYTIIEIPEPLAISLLPRLAMLSVAVRLMNAIKRRRTGFGFYAIENMDQVLKLSAKVHLPEQAGRIVIRAMAGLVMRQTRKVAFGTEGARSNYRETFGAKWHVYPPLVESLVFPALPAPAHQLGEKLSGQVCFLGSFETRKGISDLLSSWDTVTKAMPDANLVIMGHGPLASEVEDFARGRSAIATLFDPSRPKIMEILSESHVMVLPSRRTRTWREQVGLPIVEALAYGCEIVTTEETGLAEWLNAHGHEVVGGEAGDLAQSVIAAISKKRSPEEVVASLPEMDGRLAADAWLMQES